MFQGFELDEYQMAAVTAPLNTHVLVTAPPGSGKTRVLTARYVYLMEHGAPPQSTVAVTFTNKAAQEMKDRIGKALGLSEDRVRELPIATFHSLCARWLRKYAPKLGYRCNFTICDQYHSEKVVEGVLESLGLNVSEGAVAAAIARLKDELVGPEEAATYLADREGPATTAGLDAHTFSLVYREYQKTLREMNAMDFGDLIAYAVRLFNGAVPLSRLGVRHLLVDECQDINTAQYELIRLFAEHGIWVFLVGDLDQSIYGWRGSRPRLIRLFAALYEPQVYRLVYNYRSRDTIVQVANAVIRPNYADADTFAPMQAVRPGGRVRWFNIPYTPATYKTIPYFPAVLVRSLVEAGTPPGSIAVLCRYSGPLESVWRSLLAAGVPARLVKMRRGLKSPLQPFVLVSANPQDAIALRILLEQLRDIGPVLAEKITHLASGQNSLSSLVVALRGAATKIGRRRAIESLLALVKALEKLRDALASAAPGSTLGDVLKEPAEVLLSAVDVADRNVDDVETALEMAGNYPATQDGLVELASMLGLVSGDVLAQRDEMVTVSTIHAAKGLEYDVVILLEVPSRLFYDGARCADQEERRVFYVGLTRAAERLYIVTYFNEAVLHDQASFVHAMLGDYSVDPIQLKSGFMMDMAAVAEAGDDVVSAAVPAAS